jgi:8-oxo-dGTP diphosphatase
MEDKWFAYFADDTLYWHRSWTGICIYVADFTQDGDTYHIERLRANRNKEQYGETNDDSDVGLFLRLVDNLLINRRI